MKTRWHYALSLCRTVVKSWCCVIIAFYVRISKTLRNCLEILNNNEKHLNFECSFVLMWANETRVPTSSAIATLMSSLTLLTYDSFFYFRFETMLLSAQENYYFILMVLFFSYTFELLIYFSLFKRLLG